ncbi:hypothetical protein ACFL0T_05380 [Candidatus Omnitrophota bacterium]
MARSINLALRRAITIYQVDKICIVLAAASIVPFLLHLIPYGSGREIGPIWLPIYYAPFLAVFFFKPHVSLITALAAPSLNRLFTGSPMPGVLWQLTIELFLFILLANLLYVKHKRWVGVSLVSILLTKAISRIFSYTAAGLFGLGMQQFSFFLSISRALPGMTVLLIINIAVVLLKDRLSYGRD